jgi:hypothetical protein
MVTLYCYYKALIENLTGNFWAVLGDLLYVLPVTSCIVDSTIPLRHSASYEKGIKKR